MYNLDRIRRKREYKREQKRAKRKLVTRFNYIGRSSNKRIKKQLVMMEESDHA